LTGYTTLTYPPCFFSATKGHDINVVPVWKQGITGKGVVVTILDDGIEYTHPDLRKNYDKKASFDYNDHDKDPAPRFTTRDVNKHGTR
jgi:furin